MNFAKPLNVNWLYLSDYILKSNYDIMIFSYSNITQIFKFYVKITFEKSSRFVITAGDNKPIGKLRLSNKKEVKKL